MKQESRELIDRYVYDVVRRLAKKQQKEMQLEIQSRIHDMIEEKGYDVNNTEEVKLVLMELGSPEKIAKEYQNEKRYLIGPDHYEQYMWIMKIVILATSFGLILSHLMIPMLEQPINWMEYVICSIANLINGLVTAFAFVTFIFAIIERKNITTKQREWKLEDLPQIPEKQVKIKKGSIMAGIVFTILVLILFNFVPQFMGINYIEAGKINSYPLFNLEVLRTVLPLFNLAMISGIVRDILKVLYGKYTKKLAIWILILNVIAMFLSIWAFTTPNIMNNNIMEGIVHLTQENKIQDISVIQDLFHHFSTFFLGILGFAYILDTGEAIYRSIQYGKQ